MAKLMYDELKEMLCEELNNVVKKGSLTKDSLDNTHKLASSLKDLATIKAMEESYDGYSENSYRYDGRRSYDGRGSYDYGRSYDGRHGRDADNDGRYSERSYRGSYDMGYSGHDMSTKERLEDMLRSARTEQEREQIKHWMREAN